jgi:hypothetical protein
MSASTLSIAPSNGRGLQLTSIDDVMRFARIVVTSGLAPKSFDTPEKVVIALVTGMELGISAMQSLQGLAVTNGRIGVMGDLALALCQASPDFEDYQEDWLGIEGADDWGCRITVKRRNQTPKVGQFTVHEAKKAKLWEKRGKDGAATPWITYPQRMLRYRALGFVLRDAFPDVLKGVKTVEELQDYPEEARSGFSHAKPVEGNVVEGEPKQPESSPLPPAARSNGNDHTDKAQAATSEGQAISGMVERAWPNDNGDQAKPVRMEGFVARTWFSDFQGKRYWHAMLDKGQRIQTTDKDLGEQLLEFETGYPLKAWVIPSAKPNRYYLDRFVAEQEQTAANP